MYSKLTVKNIFIVKVGEVRKLTYTGILLKQ